MPASKCCIAECNSPKTVVRHAFPKNDEDFQEWVERTGNPVLKGLPKAVVLKKYAICRNHFDESCLSPGTKRLNFRSLPTLHLPSNTNEIHFKHIFTKLMPMLRVPIMFFS